MLHGALWLVVKTDGPLHDRARQIAGFWWIILLVVTAGFLVYSYLETKLYENFFNRLYLFVIPLAAVIALLACRFYLAKKSDWKAWFASAVFILTAVFFCIVGLFPNMLPSTIDPDVNSITCYNAASTPLTLTVMLIVVLVFIPLVLAYQLWAYVLFSQKIRQEELIY